MTRSCLAAVLMTALRCKSLRQDPITPAIPVGKSQETHPSGSLQGRIDAECCYCRLKDFRRIATRYDKLTPNFFPPSASSPPWSTGDGLIESGPRPILAYPISTVSRKPRIRSVSGKPFLRRFYVHLRTEDPNLRRGAWRPSSTSRGDVLAYRGGDVGGLVAGSRCKMHRQLVNFRRGGEEFRRLAAMSTHGSGKPREIAGASPGVAGGKGVWAMKASLLSVG
jgi:hypothetical protein